MFVGDYFFCVCVVGACTSALSATRDDLVLDVAGLYAAAGTTAGDVQNGWPGATRRRPLAAGHGRRPSPPRARGSLREHLEPCLAFAVMLPVVAAVGSIVLPPSTA